MGKQRGLSNGVLTVSRIQFEYLFRVDGFEAYGSLHTNPATYHCLQILKYVNAHYYRSHEGLDPAESVPVGPGFDWSLPTAREALPAGQRVPFLEA